MEEKSASEAYQVPLAVYDELERATPGGRTEIVLRLIEEHPNGRLELPTREGKRACLVGIDLSRDTLKARRELLAKEPPWWDAQLQGANLGVADLRGADLGHANLQGADLGGAQLQGTDLGGADLRGAFLWLADLQGASLVDAQFQGDDLSSCTLVRAFFCDAWLDRTMLQ